ncbi:hypothetical protein CO180_03890 [candidate division WWE3 bacterium CG_4_9_14_3_um_filter_41_6]|uniref:Cell division protein FtsL n=1 Tax=candidate division WWE3 bacterium CG_4_10_14_0_2_um_filter_41_14 TaxID=1975072 RepID=A0A2M7THY8_UNCKA|nr:MAG: hypothetical protein COY32_04435 [candidate division WWE3 bacterium CG_4_10_14_0_2_um_filter_41_14]PJA38280.1 MAG: hypothetical protein CO180_03890 [candidate division WWE3 bacterium CG_4_9_14_3_um_filter_41_6]
MKTILNKNKQNQNVHSFKQITFVTSLTILVCALFAAQIFLAARFATTGQEISILEKQKADYQEKIEDLSYEIATISAMPVIEKRAVEELHMSSAFSHVEYISGISSGSVVAAR